jgi:hypothetical protein
VLSVAFLLGLVRRTHPSADRLRRRPVKV